LWPSRLNFYNTTHIHDLCTYIRLLYIYYYLDFFRSQKHSQNPVDPVKRFVYIERHRIYTRVLWLLPADNLWGSKRPRGSIISEFTRCINAHRDRYYNNNIIISLRLCLDALCSPSKGIIIICMHIVYMFPFPREIMYTGTCVYIIYIYWYTSMILYRVYETFNIYHIINVL